MSDSDTKPPARRRKRRKTISIGGTSQSAFAGYAPRTASDAQKTKGKRPKVDNPVDGDDAGADADAEE